MPTMFVVGGTFEHQQWGQCSSIVENIDNSWKKVWLDYPAVYAGKMSYKQSSIVGKKNLYEQVSALPHNEPYVFLAFSQGAKIAGDIAARLTFDPNLRRVYLIADPERHIDDILVGPHVEGQGVYGQRRVGSKCRQFAQPGDIICANQNPVFTYMAGSTAMMCIQHPLLWMKEAGQGPWPPRVDKKTVTEITKFLKSKVHVSYNQYEVAPGITVPDWIVNDIKEL